MQLTWATNTESIIDTWFVQQATEIIRSLTDEEVEKFQEKGEITKSGFTFVEGDLRLMYKFDSSKEAKSTYDAHSDKQVSIVFVSLGSHRFEKLNSTCFICLIWFFFRPSQQFFSYVGIVFLGWTSAKLGLMCLAQGHNAMMPMRLEPVAFWSWVKHATTEPLGFLNSTWIWSIIDGIFS